jgi:hypothetical protein
VVLAALATGLLGAQAAHAQRFERRAPRFEATSGFEDRGPAVYGRGRGQDPYSTRPGFSGTITANTPNEYGNLGGPGTGGGGGGR